MSRTPRRVGWAGGRRLVVLAPGMAWLTVACAGWPGRGGGSAPAQGAQRAGGTRSPQGGPQATPTPAPAQDPVRVALAPAEKSVKPGEQFEVEVVIDGGVPTRAVQFGLRCDPALLAVESVTEGSHYRSWAREHGAQTVMLPFVPRPGAVGTGGIALLGGPPDGGPSGRGVLATVRLLAARDGAGAGTLDLTDVIVASVQVTALPVELGGGEIVVAAG